MPANINDVLEVTTLATFASTEEIANVYQLRQNASPAGTDADLFDDMREFADGIAALIRVFATALTVWQAFRLRNITQGIVYGEFAMTAPLAGNAAGDPGASQIAALVSLQTGVPRVVLRKYIGPLAEGGIDGNGFITSGSLANLGTYATFLLTTFVATNSTYTYGHDRPNMAGFVVPIGFSASNIPATQRRRRRGVGS
jgi:hypothetical protein